MATSKETHSRPFSQHRLSASAMASGTPMRQTTARQHAHSLSLSSINTTHRVTRRKSMSSASASQIAAAAAKMHGAGETQRVLPPRSNRRSMNAAMTQSTLVGTRSGAVGQPQAFDVAQARYLSEMNEDAIADEIVLASSIEPNARRNGNRSRSLRTSEGSSLPRTDGRRENGGDLRCNKCGKGYKHSSCLAKHLWEHTPEWSYTSKLLISKHQQVQLLEAASVLVAMNQEANTEAETAQDVLSDKSSASPAASRTSDLPGGMSSADTTPPPREDEDRSVALPIPRPMKSAKRRSSNGSAYSQSHQSGPLGSLLSDRTSPSMSSFGELRQVGDGFEQSYSRSTPIGHPDEDEAGLAAAVGLLSCSYGTPRSGPRSIPADVPPVPPLPARFANETSQSRSSRKTSSSANQRADKYVPSLRRPSDRDSAMVLDESEESTAEDELRLQSRSDEDDDGVFGRMEE